MLQLHVWLFLLDFTNGYLTASLLFCLCFVSLDIAETLLEAGADPKSRTVHKATPLGMFGAPLARMLLHVCLFTGLCDFVLACVYLYRCT